MIRGQSLLALYLRPFLPRVLLLFVLLLGGIGLQLYTPQLIRRFLDDAQAGVAVQVLVGTAVVYLIATIIEKGLALGAVYISEDLGWATTNNLRLDTTEHVLNLDMGFHKLRPAGELIERIDGDISHLAEYFSELIVIVLGNLLLAGGILILLFREEWRIGLVGVLYGLCMWLVLRLLQRRVVRYWRAVSESFAQLFGFLGERFGGLEDIRGNGGEPYVMRRLGDLLRKTMHMRVRAEVVGNFSFGTGFFLYAVALAATLGISANRYQLGQMSIGTVYLMYAYVRQLESPFNAIRREIEVFQRALSSIRRLDELLAVKPKVAERITAVLPPAAPTVQFNQVTFAYKDQVDQAKTASESNSVTAPSTTHEPQTVLTNLSFTLKAGKVLGLLGRTGSGKTTMSRLLFRLYDIDTGAILLNGVDIRHVGLADLRRHIGLVTQDVQLFAATVRDNITLFANYDDQQPPIHDEQIMEAIQLLGLHPWFQTLPNGLDTLLGNNGQGLSAGEAQLLALTRLFLRNPSLVILDEASSRLDPMTEQLLERAVERLLENRTGIIIAHRLATVQRADEILILENGRVLEHGPRLELASNPTSRFAHLLKTGLTEMMA